MKGYFETIDGRGWSGIVDSAAGPFWFLTVHVESTSTPLSFPFPINVTLSYNMENVRLEEGGG